jgi:hypothetical protein
MSPTGYWEPQCAHPGRLLIRKGDSAYAVEHNGGAVVSATGLCLPGKPSRDVPGTAECTRG